ncbi:flavodoxin [Lactiplantibacillus brownii]
MKIKTTGRGAVSDGQDTNTSQARTRVLSPTATTLIIYFSRSGNTEKQVRFAQTQLTTDVYELGVQHPYPASYTASVARATAEREAQQWPALSDDSPDLSQYQLILLAHPIWAMTLANPMRAFLVLAGDQLAGKQIASFSTNAGYGSGETQRVLQLLTPSDTEVLPNYSVQDTQANGDRKAFSRWLRQVRSH